MDGDDIGRACASKGREEDGGSSIPFLRYIVWEGKFVDTSQAFEGWLSRISRLDVGIRENTTV